MIVLFVGLELWVYLLGGESAGLAKGIDLDLLNRGRRQSSSLGCTSLVADILQRRRGPASNGWPGR